MDQNNESDDDSAGGGVILCVLGALLFWGGFAIGTCVGWAL